MCIILIGRITEQMHNLAKTQNPDGFSLFTMKQGLVKAPTAQQVKDAIGKFGIWHYRIGTSGKKGTYNVHPFEVCGGEYYLYHNGIVGTGVGDKSDTHALADLLFTADVKTARSVLTSLSAHNRFVLVRADDPYNYEIFGDWAFDEGVLMSHKLYTPVYKYGNQFTFDESKAVARGYITK